MMTLAELGAFALLTYWLYVAFAYQKPAQVLQTKLQLLLVATLASGALLHAWRRWSQVGKNAVYQAKARIPACLTYPCGWHG
ncbi:MAG: hypothetical protein ACREXW_19620 [Gammaproteobacteria bacterium]